MALARQSDDPISLVEAGLAMGTTRYFQGQFEEAGMALTEATTAYDPSLAREHMQRFGEDGGVASETYVAVNAWCLGEIDQARSRINAAIERARELKNAFTLVYILVGASWLFQRCGEIERTASLADEALIMSS